MQGDVWYFLAFLYFIVDYFFVFYFSKYLASKAPKIIDGKKYLYCSKMRVLKNWFFWFPLMILLWFIFTPAASVFIFILLVVTSLREPKAFVAWTDQYIEGSDAFLYNIKIYRIEWEDVNEVILRRTSTRRDFHLEMIIEGKIIVDGYLCGYQELLEFVKEQHHIKFIDKTFSLF